MIIQEHHQGLYILFAFQIRTYIIYLSLFYVISRLGRKKSLIIIFGVYTHANSNHIRHY